VSVPSQHHSLVPNLLIATIILGSAVSLIRQREYWPFSPYSMFARLQGPEVATFDIVGVAAAGAHEEIPLAPSRRTRILAGRRNQDALALLVDGDPRELYRYLTGAARRFAEQQPTAPTLRRVRLYRSRWEARPQQSPPATRVVRELVSEIELPGGRPNGR
jgi:hypothetical protein